ncbi:transposase [Starkeya koreensis]|uniref:Transposase n=1 Tax=Ancylobacter koreensis TaxID=266121 RepID=A0ABT0DIL1_9HYPH|nr:transposase [Ancylobacter koreensis]MCK0207119.1 transposase [Ancylobacter koreensis]
MRRSQFTESEIIHLIQEADAGVPVDEICRTAQVSLRTFYRWRRRFGGLSAPAVMQMKELEAENRRLRALVSNLSQRLHHPPLPGEQPHLVRGAGPLQPHRASVLAADRCGGAVVGRFASVRVAR